MKTKLILLGICIWLLLFVALGSFNEARAGISQPPIMIFGGLKTPAGGEVTTGKITVQFTSLADGSVVSTEGEVGELGEDINFVFKVPIESDPVTKADESLSPGSSYIPSVYFNDRRLPFAQIPSPLTPEAGQIIGPIDFYLTNLGPLLEVSEDINFGYSVIGSFVDKTFEVNNPGSETLTGTAAMNEGSHFRIVKNGYPVNQETINLAPGQSQSITIRFYPLNVGSDLLDVFEINTNGGDLTRLVFGDGVTVTPTMTATPDLTQTPVVTGTIYTPTATPTPTHAAPFVSIEADQYAGAAPMLVQFTGSALDSDGIITKYGWSIKEEGVLDVTSEYYSNMIEAITSNRYLIPGVYVAGFQVWDNHDLAVSATTEIVIWTPTPIPTATPTNYPPVVSLSANPLQGPAPLAVNLVGSASDADSFLAQVYWIYDDGLSPVVTNVTSKSYVSNSSYTYTKTGTHQVKFYAVDNDQAVAYASKMIQVWTPTPTPTPVVLDPDCDGFMGETDLYAFLGTWHQKGLDKSNVDLYPDGQVDFRDLMYLASIWTPPRIIFTADISVQFQSTRILLEVDMDGAFPGTNYSWRGNPKLTSYKASSGDKNILELEMECAKPCEDPIKGGSTPFERLVLVDLGELEAGEYTLVISVNGTPQLTKPFYMIEF